MADESQRVREGRSGFRVPGSLTDRQGLAVEARLGEEGDQGEEAEQGRGGAENGEVRPLALGLDTKMSTDLPGR